MAVTELAEEETKTKTKRKETDSARPDREGSEWRRNEGKRKSRGEATK